MTTEIENTESTAEVRIYSDQELMTDFYPIYQIQRMAAERQIPNASKRVAKDLASGLMAQHKVNQLVGWLGVNATFVPRGIVDMALAQIVESPDPDSVVRRDDLIVSAYDGTPDSATIDLIAVNQLLKDYGLVISVKRQRAKRNGADGSSENSASDETPVGSDSAPKRKRGKKDATAEASEGATAEGENQPAPVENW